RLDRRADTATGYRYPAQTGSWDLRIFLDLPPVVSNGLLPFVKQWIILVHSRHLQPGVLLVRHFQRGEAYTSGKLAGHLLLKFLQGFVGGGGFRGQGERLTRASPESIAGDGFNQHRNLHRSGSQHRKNGFFDLTPSILKL